MMIKKLLLILLFCFFVTPVFATNISNADIDDEDMADITDWTDEDIGTGVSSQATFDSKSCMKLDSGGTITGQAIRTQDIGTFGTRTVYSLSLYCDAIGTNASGDWFYWNYADGTTIFAVRVASDGLFVRGTSAFVEVGTDLVVQDTWQEWTFDINWTAKTVDVYLDQVLKASGVDCNFAVPYTNGLVSYQQHSDTTANRITYIDWEKSGSDFVTAERRIMFIQ